VVIWLVLGTSLALIAYPNPGASGPAGAAYFCDTLDYKSIWGKNFLQYDSRNYSLTAPLATFCSTIPASAAGKILYYQANGASASGITCNVQDIQNQLSQIPPSLSPVGAFTSFLSNPLFSVLVPQLPAAGLTLNQSVPIFACSSYPLSAPWIGGVNTQRIWGAFQFLKYVNTTNNFITLTPPVLNSLWMNWLTAGSSTQFYFVCCIIVALCLMIVSSAKLIQFLHFDGFKFKLPQVCLLIGFFASIVGLFVSNFGYFAWRAPSAEGYTVIFFFVYWLLGFGFTIAVLFSFYFIEVSKLTASQSAGGLGYFIIPALVLIGLQWLMILIVGGLNANPTQGVDTASSQSALTTAQFAGFVIVLSIQFILTCYASFVVLLASKGTTQFGSILRVVGLSLLASASLCAFGIAAVVFQNFSSANDSGSSTFLQLLGYYEMFLWFVPMICMILYLLNFKISLQKEIEISKSGTSSTSSMGASKSSSSSSSGNDPVIEL